MSLRTVIVLLMSIVCGISAAVGVNVLLGQNRTATPQKVKTVPVVVAAVNVPRAVRLKPEQLITKDWPEAHVPQDAIQDIEEAIDKTTLQSLVVGEPLLKAKISLDGSGGAAALVKPGLRAFTIHTSTASAGVAGMVMPGNIVDVLLTMKGNSGIAGGGGTWILLQNVQVLTADQRLDQEDERKTGRLSSVTLHVTPDQTTILTLAQTMGTLNLSLRNDTDDDVVMTPPRTMNDLRFLQDPGGRPSTGDEPPAGGNQEPLPDVDPRQIASNVAQAHREILALRGNSASLIRVSNPGISTDYLRNPSAEGSGE
jgi:pilus assembly protein CpaB